MEYNNLANNNEGMPSDTGQKVDEGTKLNIDMIL